MACAEGLSTSAQVGWGLFGGVFVVCAKLRQFWRHIPGTAQMSTHDKVNVVVWCLMPFFGAGCVVAFHAHNEAIAIYEGSSLPALFYSLANHYHHQPPG